MSREFESNYNVALVGASSLKGSEVKQLLKDRRFPLGRLALLDVAELGGQLTEFEDEPAIILPVTKESFEDIALAIFASPPAFTKDHWQMAQSAGCDIIDLSYFLDSNPAALLRAPVLENSETNDGPPAGELAKEKRIVVSPHPAAIAIAAILLRLNRLSPVQRSVFNVFEPASEHGQAGIDEVHQQTVKLLAFQTMPRLVFDAQVAFNMLSRYGEKSVPPLQEVENRISAHAAKLLGGRVPQPHLRLIQAPVFHGYTLSCFVELQDSVSVEAIEKSLNEKPLQLVEDRHNSPSAVSAADSEDILLGRVEKDSASAAGYWIWGAFDNLKLAALNAVEAAEQLALPALRRSMDEKREGSRTAI